VTVNDYEEALQAAEKLSRLDDDALFEQLGIRVQDEKNEGGLERQRKFDAEFPQDAADMLSLTDVREIGRRWWAKLEPELLRIVCTQDSKEMGKITGGKTIPQIAASLATAGAVAVLAPPAWVIVATSILAAKIAETGLDATCEVWRESIDARGVGESTG
jgi:hypothetical protein